MKDLDALLKALEEKDRDVKDVDPSYEYSHSYYESLVGHRMKGFKYSEYVKHKDGGFSFSPAMEKYIGQTGTILKYHECGAFKVEFKRPEEIGTICWWYPAKEAIPYIIKTKKL